MSGPEFLNKLRQHLTRLSRACIKQLNNGDINQKLSASDIHKIDFEGGIANFYVKVTDCDMITVQGYNLPDNSYTVEKDNNILKIAYNGENIRSRTGITDIIANVRKINVTLPSKRYEEFDFSAGAGDSVISNLSVNKLDIDGGIGNITLNNVVSYDDAEFSLGIGDTHINDSSFNKSEFEIGTGNLEFSGRLKGNTKIENGVGNVTMNINGFKNEYNIRYDNGVGEVEIKGSDYSNDNVEKTDMFIDNGVGKVTLNFK